MQIFYLAFACIFLLLRYNIRMKLWIKAFKKDKLIINELLTNSLQLNCANLTSALMELCDKHDLPTPIVTENNLCNLNAFNHTKFTQRDFLEKIAFDYMEISNIPK